MLVLTLLFFWGFTLSGTRLFSIKNSPFSQFDKMLSICLTMKPVGSGNWKSWKVMSDSESCSSELEAIFELWLLGALCGYLCSTYGNLCIRPSWVAYWRRLREDACLSLQVHFVYHWHWLMLLNCVFFFFLNGFRRKSHFAVFSL
jgi:hypothetical protein